MNQKTIDKAQIEPLQGSVKGYAQRRLVVELPALDVEVEQLSKKLLRKYLGGRGLNVRYLFDHQNFEFDPLSPENPIIFATGPFAGTLYPGGGRLNVTGHSPQTGLLGDSNTGGFWGAELKACGFDQLVIKGRSCEPGVLSITDDTVTYHKVPDIEKATIKETINHVEQVLPGSDWQILSTGPAAWRGVRFSGLFTNAARAAARTGMGTLLASKGIKAIAVRGQTPVSAAEPERFASLLKRLDEQIYQHPEYLERTFLGTTKLMNALNDLGALSTNHYTSGVFCSIDKVSGETLARTYKTRSKACHGCNIPCSRALDVKGQIKMEGPEFEGLAGFTSKLGISDLAWSLWAADYCNEQGIDVITASECVAVSMECYERGLIDQDDTGGLQLNFGNVEAAEQLLREIAQVTGFGALFKHGAVQGAAELGEEASRLVMHVKGLEIFQADPRGMKGYALGVAVASRGGDHLRSEPWLEFSEDAEEALERFGIAEIAYRLKNRGKGILVSHFENKAAISDGLEVCKNTFNNMELPDHELTAQLYQSLTGIPMDAEQLELAGERIVNLERLYNLGHGLRVEQDTLPERFVSEPLEQGPSAGETVDIQRLVDDYYKARSWDPETGFPTGEKLQELNLVDDFKQVRCIRDG